MLPKARHTHNFSFAQQQQPEALQRQQPPFAQAIIVCVILIRNELAKHPHLCHLFKVAKRKQDVFSKV